MVSRAACFAVQCVLAARLRCVWAHTDQCGEETFAGVSPSQHAAPQGSSLTQKVVRVSKGTLDMPHTHAYKVEDFQKAGEDFKKAGEETVATGAGGDNRILSTIETSSVLLSKVGNASHALTAQDKELAQKVLKMIQNSFFVALDEFHRADSRDVLAAEAAVRSCNAAANARRVSSGDVGLLESRVQKLQANHTSLHKSSEEKRGAQVKAEKALKDFAKAIPAPEPCSLCEGMPQGSDNIDQWKGFFEKPDWFHKQKEVFDAKVADHEGAVMALEAVSQKEDTNRAVLKEVFCIWKVELEGTCGTLQKCYKNKTAIFNATISRVRRAEATRLNAQKAGEALLAHVKFILGQAGYVENTTVDNSSRYELVIPKLAEMNVCDLSELTREEWGHSSPCEDPEPSGPEPYTGPAVYSKFVTHVENGVCKEPGFVAIKDKAECQQAAKDKGVSFSVGNWATNHNGPCFTEKNYASTVYWNNAVGQLSDHGCPVCKKAFLA